MMSLQGMGQCSGSLWVCVLATGGELWQTLAAGLNVTAKAQLPNQEVS